MNIIILRLVWKGKQTPQLFFYIQDNKAFINRRIFFFSPCNCYHSLRASFNRRALRASDIVDLHEKMSFSFAPTVCITSDTMFYMFKLSTTFFICRLTKFGLVVKTTGEFSNSIKSKSGADTRKGLWLGET